MSIVSVLVGTLAFVSPSFMLTGELPQIVDVPPTLLAIADCESGKRDNNGRAIKGSATHYDTDGSVLLGKYTDSKYGVDIGKYQINSLYHEETANEMGLDLYVEEENEAYAMHLFDTQGVKPWGASEMCWTLSK